MQRAAEKLFHSLFADLRYTRIVAAVGASIACAAVAQPAPLLTAAPDIEQIRAQERQQQEQQRIEQQQRTREQQVQEAATRLMPDAAPSQALLVEGESPCFTLREIRFDGINDTAVPAVLLTGLEQAIGSAKDKTSRKRVSDSPLNRCLGAKSINTLIERAQNHLIMRGYITSRVLAQQQDLKPGVLTLTVIAGKVAALRQPVLEGAWRQASKAGLHSALPTGPGQLLNLRDIEQGLENLKRAPTAEADIQITPAQQNTQTPDALPFGQSDLLISYQQNRPIRFNVSLDDSGTDATGKYQGALTLSLDNPLTLNDLFYVSAYHSLNGAASGTRGYSVSYSVPWGYWLLGARYSQNDYHQSVAGASQNYTYSGDSANAELFISRVLFRDSKRKTTATLKAWGRNSHNYIEDVEIEVQRRRLGGWAAGLQHRQYIGPARLDLSLDYKRGTGAFNALPAPEQAFGEGTSRFTLLTAEAALDLPFSIGRQNLRYNGLWRWQHNRTPLTPQDRFAIGGRYTVRGFDGQTSLLGERGWLLRNDLGWNIANSGQELYAGIDHGQIGGPSAQWQSGTRLTGGVLGLRGSGMGWLKGLSYDIFVGTPIYKPQGFHTAKTTAGFNLNWSY